MNNGDDLHQIPDKQWIQEQLRAATDQITETMRGMQTETLRGFHEELERNRSSERLDRIEHLTAGWVEQSKHEHEENRRLWREMREDFAARDREYHARWDEMKSEFAERDKQFRADASERDQQYRTEAAERDRKLDDRIEKLVTAIGAFIRHDQEKTQ